MKQKLTVFLIVLSSFSVHVASEADSLKQYQIASHEGKKILVGKITPEDIWNEIVEWKADYMISQPDNAVIKALKDIDQNFHIIIVLGIWCSNSQSGVPGFLKALNMANNPHLTVEMYGLDGELKDPEHIADKYCVDRVPTFIVLSEKKEIGRMIEIPDTTFEADLVKLINKFTL